MKSWDRPDRGVPWTISMESRNLPLAKSGKGCNPGCPCFGWSQIVPFRAPSWMCISKDSWCRWYQAESGSWILITCWLLIMLPYQQTINHRGINGVASHGLGSTNVHPLFLCSCSVWLLSLQYSYSLWVCWLLVRMESYILIGIYWYTLLRTNDHQRYNITISLLMFAEKYPYNIESYQDIAILEL